MAKLHIINRTALPLQTDLLIAGAHCAFATNSEQILASVDRWRCPSRARSNHTFEMNVFLDPSLPSNRDVKTQTHFRGLHHLVFATIGSHELFVFDLSRKQVAGAVSQGSASEPTFWNSHWLPITVGLMGTTVGVIPLHSACLDLDGKALLIAGVSGAGKSTLSVALARSGFSLVSDDWTYISQEADGLTAHGINAPVKLLPDAIQHFPELCGRASGLKRPPRRFVNFVRGTEVPPFESVSYGNRLDLLRRFAPTPLKAEVRLEIANVLVETNDLSFLPWLSRLDAGESSVKSCLWKIVRDVDVRGVTGETTILMAGNVIVYSMG